MSRDQAQVSYNLRFPGQYYQAETGLSQNWNRDHDPLVGRYVQSDPIGLDGGLNTYAYAANAPVMFYDATGLLCTYSQFSGELTCVNSITGQRYAHCFGYSGIGAGLNNPDAQDLPFVGPLPRGYYYVGYPTRTKGPWTLPLTPFPSNQMYNRKDFLIHGDNFDLNHTASNGCIIEGKDCRKKIPPWEVVWVTF
jgi:RHS repeat-associated protein